MAKRDEQALQEAISKARTEAGQNGNPDAPEESVPEAAVDYTAEYSGHGGGIKLRDVAPAPIALRSPERQPDGSWKTFPLFGRFVATVKRTVKGEERTLHEIEVTHRETGEAMRIRVWGSTILDDRMSMVEPGAHVEITRLFPIGQGTGKRSAPVDHKVRVAG